MKPDFICESSLVVRTDSTLLLISLFKGGLLYKIHIFIFQFGFLLLLETAQLGFGFFF